MHRLSPALLLLAGVLTVGILVQTGCKKDEGAPAGDKTATGDKAATTEKSSMSKEDMVARGKYLVTVAGCNDCHTPKLYTDKGPMPDTTRMLAGHWAAETLPPIDTTEITPGKWVLASPSFTGWVGPWGVSYAANLTPDSTTGTGGWSDEMFMKVFKQGQYIGAGGGRPIMPPMPWQMIGQMTDDDLNSIIAFLRSIPAVKNAVPSYVPPPMVASLNKPAK